MCDFNALRLQVTTETKGFVIVSLSVGAYQIIVADAADAVSVNFSGRCKFLQI